MLEPSSFWCHVIMEAHSWLPKLLFLIIGLTIKLIAGFVQVCWLDLTWPKQHIPYQSIICVIIYLWCGCWAYFIANISLNKFNNILREPVWMIGFIDSGILILFSWPLIHYWVSIILNKWRVKWVCYNFLLPLFLLV